MPIYEYRCTKGHVFDRMQRFSDDPLSECEVCGESAQRVLHAPAVHFKGSGFYNTDYGTAKRAREKETASAGKGKGESSSDSSSSDSSSSSEKKESSTGSSDSSSSSSGKKSEAKASAAK